MDYLLLNGFTKQDKSMISEVKTTQAKTPTLTKENMAENNPTHNQTFIKENDALIRFKNSVKMLNKKEKQNVKNKAQITSFFFFFLV
ncbi:hypothetical protein RGC41_08105 [Helicobacter pylori]|uniref:hypothetical protein n=1 Tax=Helicobacter pylori TaxID=210 RepID=UPI002928EB6D|nr:hypothetical protein [Helicobacter pylori]MDU9804517.1 hypothetical protein [Helicobacter pylori]